MYKTLVMHLRCASAPQFFDRVPDDRAVQGSSPSSDFFFFFIRPLFSRLLVFRSILNLIFFRTVRGLTKFKTRSSLSD